MDSALTFHERFSPDELEEQYNLSRSRPGYEVTVIPDWMARSVAARAQMTATVDLRYGAGARQTLDIYPCGDAGAPTLVYFHGGYWQRGDKKLYSFLAQPFVQAGVSVIIVGYDLCPAVTLTRIVEQAREAMVFIWHRAAQLGINRDRITVMGHSAGGHLAEMMMGTQWPMIADDVPLDLIKAGIPISPLSLLEPVRLTLGLNAALRMDAQEAEAQSPVIHHPPVTNAPQMLAVGGIESTEFHRQAQMYVDAFASPNREMTLYVVPDVDHFDEINVLAESNSPFFAKALALITA